MKHLLLIGAAALAAATYGMQSSAALAANVLVPQTGVGAKYGARDPYTCSSKTEPTTGAISSEMATQYFVCQSENVNNANMLALTANVHLQVGKALSAYQVTNFLLDNADPNSPVYPIRGSFDHYLCSVVDNSYPPDASGHNCALWHETNATGQCYRTSFGDWSCMMLGPQGPQIDGQPAPGYTGAAAAPASLQPRPAVSLQGGATVVQPTSWSNATKGLPPVAPSTPPGRTMVVAQLSGSSADIQNGMQAFRRGDYPNAYGKFHAAHQQNLNDPIGSLWEGVALEAMGRSSGFDFLAGNTDPEFSVAANELLALSDWHRGDRQNAVAVLDTCIRFNPSDTSCADMKQGVESGASAPAVNSWPAIVGLTKITQARATVWSPKQQ